MQKYITPEQQMKINALGLLMSKKSLLSWVLVAGLSVGMVGRFS